MIWGFWLAVSCFCALNSPGHGGVWVGGFHDRAACEEVREVTANASPKCERRMGP